MAGSLRNATRQGIPKSAAPHLEGLDIIRTTERGGASRLGEVLVCWDRGLPAIADSDESCPMQRMAVGWVRSGFSCAFLNASAALRIRPDRLLRSCRAR